MGRGPTPQEETHSWYCKFGQEVMTGKLTGLKGEPAAVALLTGHCIPSSMPSLMKSSVTSDLIFILDIP